MSNSREALVLFSGGKDSSAVAVELAMKKYAVKLYTYQGGLAELTGPLGDSAPDIRHKELLKVFPGNIDTHRVIEGNAYLVRELAIKKTNVEHVVYPIALALVVHANAMSYCLQHGIKTIASGYSGYQAQKDQYIEQHDQFIELTKKFLEEYGISYLTPVIDKSELEVKDILERHGISSNSLENKSLFGGIPFQKEKALEYWESCLPICREYIKNISVES